MRPFRVLAAIFRRAANSQQSVSNGTSTCNLFDVFSKPPERHFKVPDSPTQLRYPGVR
jgi:hypothetical protein